MKTHDLFKILSTFSSSEITLFEKFIKSPFYNSQSTLVRLYDILKQYHPDYKSTELNNEKIFSIVNPGKKYTDVVFRKYLSDLTRLSEEFLVQTALTMERDKYQILLLEEYYRRDINSRYEKAVNKILHEQKPVYKMDEVEMIISHIFSELRINYAIKNDKLPVDNELLMESQLHIVNYLFMQTLNNITELKNIYSSEELLEMNNIVTSLVKNFQFENFINEIDAGNDPKYLHIELCYYALMMYLNPDDMLYYKKFKKIIMDKADMLSTNVFYMHIMRLLNHCIIAINNGSNQCLREFFEIYSFAIKNPKYSEKIRNVMPFKEFRNGLFYSLELEERQWAEWYANNFLESVNPEKREDARKYADAMLNFENGNYKSVLETVSRTKHTNPIVKMDMNLLLSKTYYELEYYDSCNAIVDSFTNMIEKNNTLSPNSKKQYLNYIKFYNILSQVKSKTKNYDIDILTNELNSNTMVKTQKWLMKKAIELKEN